MKKISNFIAYFFILAVSVFTLISIGGVWELFGGDVIDKSLQSMALLAAISIVAIIADHMLDKKPEVLAVPTESQPVEQVSTFTSIRSVSVLVLIVSAVLLAFMGLLAIWEVFEKNILHKSLTSIGIIVFSCVVIALTCLERENNPILKRKLGIGWGGIIFFLIIFYFGFQILRWIF